MAAASIQAASVRAFSVAAAPVGGSAAGPYTPSYDNPGGKGVRDGLLYFDTKALENLYQAPFMGDGSYSTGPRFINEPVAGHYFSFIFGRPMLVTEIKFLQTTAASHGTWQLYGMNPSTGLVPIGGVFSLGGVTEQTIAEPSANTEEYLAYILWGVSGNLDPTPLLAEWEFKIAIIAADGAYKYSNPGGMGGRGSSVVVTASAGLFSGSPLGEFVDGTPAFGAVAFNLVSVAGHWIEFDFGEARTVDAIMNHLSDDTTLLGTWRIEGSLDNTAWDVLSADFTLGESATDEIACNASLVAYRYYRIAGVSGTIQAGRPDPKEFMFRIDGGL